jgi:hypothetical protein
MNLGKAVKTITVVPVKHGLEGSDKLTEEVTEEVPYFAVIKTTVIPVPTPTEKEKEDA